MWERLIQLFSQYPLITFSSVSVFIPIFLGIYKRAYQSLKLKLLLLYLISYCIFDLSEWVTVLIGTKNNMYLHNIGELISTLIIGLIYFKIFTTTSKKITVIILISIVIIQNILQFNWGELAGYSFTLNKIVLIIFVFLHFHSIISEMNVKNILQHSLFWMSAAILIFSCGTLFIYLFWQYTLANELQREVFHMYSNIEQVFRILFMFMLGISFWVSNPDEIHA